MYRQNKTSYRYLWAGIVIASSAVVTFLLIAAFTHPKEPKKRPNILFLFADDQRFNTINRLGNPEIITPVLDGLSEKSVVFSNAYIMGAMNAAVCAPSRAMLMTGREVFRLDDHLGLSIAKTSTTLPQMLRENGYQTHGTGKWHSGRESYTRSFTSGGKILFGGMTGNQYKLPVFEFDPTGAYPKEKNLQLTGTHSSTVYANEAIRFLKDCKKDAPFFLYLGFQAPHDPRQVDQAYLNLYNTDSLRLPPNFSARPPFDTGELDVRDELLAAIPRDLAETKRQIRDYYAIITHLDFEIGRLLEALKASGEADNTIIIFSADNGLAVGQHGLMGKQSLYEHSVKVPLLISIPGVAGQTISDFTYLQDILPTIADLLKIKTPAKVWGKSFKERLYGKGRASRKTLFFAYKHFQRAYRQGDWKLITYNVGGKKYDQLFNLKEDPWEINNRYSSEHKIAQTLKVALQKELTAAGDSVKLDRAGWGVKEIASWAKLNNRNGE